jgi:cytochrome c oxidase cbb3-type subunit 3
MSPSGTLVCVAVAALVAAAATGWIATTGRPSAAAPAPRYSEGPPASVPTGDLAGAAVARLPASLKNPFSGDANAIQEGRRLYVRLNCADCHGFDAKGAMGPDLTDTYWRYGGTPVQIYKSIYEGRPQGMPAWGHGLPASSIWQLTAYVESLGGSFAPEDYHKGLQGDLSAPQDRTAKKSGATTLEGQ